ncbi:MAG: (4Fe-4S)-binding protein [Chitinophagaceae bacterium]|nr:(4Fe-4S)-binding protein [Chitinophagaceae bacterium]
MDINNITKEYSNGDITVVWQSAKCIHSGNCVKNLPSVFKPREQPWIQLDQEDSQAIRDAVAKCPSGALSIKES